MKSRLPKPPLHDPKEIDEAFSLDSGYSAGPVVLWFLADQFGEQIHHQLLRGAANTATFWSHLLRLTRTESPRQLYEGAFEWLAARGAS